MELDRFELGKFLDGKASDFATLPAFLESAKREFRITFQKCVHPNGACSNAPAGRQSRVEVARPDTG